MRSITGWGVFGSNSVLLAPASPRRCGRTRSTAICRPRQRPKKGCRFSRANWRADLALGAAVAEAAGHEDAVEVASYFAAAESSMIARRRSARS
jgi:hypothetical protein